MTRKLSALQRRALQLLAQDDHFGYCGMWGDAVVLKENCCSGKRYCSVARIARSTYDALRRARDVEPDPAHRPYERCSAAGRAVLATGEHAARQAILSEMVAEAQELGFYEEGKREE